MRQPRIAPRRNAHLRGGGLRAARRPAARPRRHAMPRAAHAVSRRAHRTAARRAVAGLAIALGAASFALGERIHRGDQPDFGAFLWAGLTDGSIWLLLAGAFVASFGVALWFDADADAAPQRRDGSRLT